MAVLVSVLGACSGARAFEPDDETSHETGNVLVLAVAGGGSLLRIEPESPVAGAGNVLTIGADSDPFGDPFSPAFSPLSGDLGLEPGSLSQAGTGNSLSLAVTGLHNLVAAAQAGADNMIDAVVAGTRNEASVTQSGQGNIAVFSQAGIGNIVSISQ